MLGFLSPSGVFHECDYHGHMPLADRLLEQMYHVKSNNPVDKLCRFGWVVIQSSFVGFAGDDAYNSPELTKEQILWLEERKNKMTVTQCLSLKLCLEINEVLYG